MKKYTLALAMGIFGLAACNLEVTDTDKKTGRKLRTQDFPAYTGHYTGSAKAYSAGLEVTCDVDLVIKQKEKTFEVTSLNYDCADGQTWGADEAIVVDLIKPQDKTQAAWDLFSGNKKVGFLNYSNSYMYAGFNDFTGKVEIALSQSKKGVKLEAYQVASSNNLLLFRSINVDLKKQKR